jgi:XTP/dITP diphosphohydrolase
MERLIFASNNEGKIKEVKQLLHDFPIKVESLKDIGIQVNIIEDQESFEKNALKKATEIMKITGKWVLSDDSGLEVDALNGQPGVYSARFAGEKASDEENNQKLLRMMQQIPDSKRGAQFRCVVALVSPKGHVIQTEGICRGKIGHAPKGNNGFGYDPLFIANAVEKTFAELTEDEKNIISHRAIALKKLKELIRERYTIYADV